MTDPYSIQEYIQYIRKLEIFKQNHLTEDDSLTTMIQNDQFFRDMPPNINISKELFVKSLVATINIFQERNQSNREEEDRLPNKHDPTYPPKDISSIPQVEKAPEVHHGIKTLFMP
jgi:hypothetical protein